MIFIHIRNIFFWLSILSSSVLQAQNSLSQFSNELAKEFKSTDTLFNKPYVDVDEWREEPLRHRYVHGGFEGTDTRFSFYFPPKEKYAGRFFQYFTPFPDSENLAQNAKGESDMISFSEKSGAYFIETNGGGKFDFPGPE